MYFLLLNTLTEDEFDVLQAKFHTASAMSLKVQNDVEELMDGLSADYTYQQRYEHTSEGTYNTPDWYAAVAMSDALNAASEVAYSQRQMRDEIRSLLG
jgi:hypothetical protein